MQKAACLFFLQIADSRGSKRQQRSKNQGPPEAVNMNSIHKFTSQNYYENIDDQKKNSQREDRNR